MTATPPEVVRSLGSNLFHPVFLVSILFVLINDKVFKRHFPALITGKLSDVGGLFALPVFLASLIEIASRRFVSLKVMAAILFVVTALFVGMKTNKQISNSVAEVWFQLLRPIRAFNSDSSTPVTFVRDASDLIALISVPPVFYFWKTKSP